MITKQEFINRRIINSNSSTVIDTFDSICPNFYDIQYNTPSEYMEHLWSQYELIGNRSNSANGKIFEYMLISLFIREGIFPFYYQTQITFVSNVNFDFFIYTEEGPITLSVKTSLRERYKQAVLEADTMLDVHRNSLNYLVSLDSQALETVNNKMDRREIISLAGAIYIFSEDFDRLIYLIKSKRITTAPDFNLVKHSQVLIDS
jgi:hypothetical protein